MNFSTPAPDLDQIFPGESEMARRMRAFDWANTDLGPPEGWPQNLRMALSICLTSQSPLLLWWGPGLRFFYNDACIPFLGTLRHPTILGLPGREACPEIWFAIGSMLEGVLATGKASVAPDIRLWSGQWPHPEESRVAFSFSPIFGAGNTVDGVFSVCAATTGTIAGLRRLEASAGEAQRAGKSGKAAALPLRKAERERLEQRVQSTEHALDETQAELRTLNASLFTAQEEERRRIARELHDDFSQRLALLEFDAERLREHLAPEARGSLDQISRRVAELSLDLRRMSHRLHPSVVEDLGLVAALRELAEEYRQQGIDIRLTADPPPPTAPLPVATTMYRIAQEALRNVAKHAPGAAVRIDLHRSDSELRLCIEDSGPGFAFTRVRDRGGLGLLSMQERARAAGGRLQMHTQPGRGTSVTVLLPLKEESRAS